MAPSLLQTTGLLLLLGLKTVSADLICSANPSPPSDVFCGVNGVIDYFALFQEDLFDAYSSTPEGCAEACFQHTGCSSFYVNPGGFCELHSGNEVQTGFKTDPDSTYAGYDITCFVCADPSTVTTAFQTTSAVPTTSSVPTTSAIPTTSSIPTTSAIPTTSSIPTTLAIPTTSSVPTTSAVLTTSSIPTTSAIPTTSSIPTTSAIPTTSSVSTTSAVLKTSNVSTTSNSTTIPYFQNSTSIQNSTSPNTFSSTSDSTAVSTSLSSNKTTTRLCFSASRHYQNSTTGYSPYTTGAYVQYTSHYNSRSQETSARSKTSGPLSSASVFESLSQTSASASKATVLSPGFTSSTVYSISTYTVTSCAPTITNCPLGAVTTETIAVYTRTFPVNEIQASTAPEVTSVPAGYMTSTVYTTKIYTITSCAPTITDCPLGKVTTETSSLYTTICPESEAYSSPVTKQTGASSEGLIASIAVTSILPSSNAPQTSAARLVTLPSAQPTFVQNSAGNLTTNTTTSSLPLQVTSNARAVVGTKWNGIIVICGLAAVLVL